MAMHICKARGKITRNKQNKKKYLLILYLWNRWMALSIHKMQRAYAALHTNINN